MQHAPGVELLRLGTAHVDAPGDLGTPSMGSVAITVK